MNIRTATRDDERWLRRQAKFVPDDLKAKYAAMRANLFEFLRATHYRWSVTIARRSPHRDHARAHECRTSLSRLARPA